MPIVPPRLDDRNFDDLVEELLSRIPAHTPEWTHARQGDPGRTLLELFAWLADTVLYRVNLIPDRQRLAFLRLLGIQLRPAVASTSVVGVRFDSQTLQPSVVLRPYSEVRGPVPFETRTELPVLHLTAEAYYKRPLTQAERQEMSLLLTGLSRVYGLSSAQAAYYVTTALFPGGVAESAGFDVVERTVDHCLWLALLAPTAADVAPLRQELNTGSAGAPRVLSVGIMPSIEVPALHEEIGPRARIPHQWELSGVPDAQGNPTYHLLSVAYDSSQGLTRRGVIHLVMPGHPIGVPSNDVRQSLHAGVGDRPPRLDDVKRTERLVAWLRLRPTVRLSHLSLSWVGINAVEVEQRRTYTAVVVGQGDGTPDQELKLPMGSVERESLQLEVEEPGQGYRPWTLVDDLTLTGRDSAAFQLDAEAGLVRFGNGVRGRIPVVGMRVRVARMRTGGGVAGNLPAGTLKALSALTLDGTAPSGAMKVEQAMPTQGGQDAETLPDAERRIPSTLRHGERAVTAEDFRWLAAGSPGATPGRVEVLPRFKPHQRRENVPGVVTVMVLPPSSTFRAPNPRPDRPFLEGVHAHLDARRPLATELYVIGCEYVPLGLATGITVREGFGRETVVNAVREALFRWLWPLPPAGPQGGGWTLGRAVRDRELEVAIAQVPGVDSITGVRLFSSGTVVALPPTPSGSDGPTSARFEVRPAASVTSTGASGSALPASTSPSPSGWRALAGPVPGMPVELVLRPWQLPELMAVVVDADGGLPRDLKGAPDPFQSQPGVAVPVVPEVC
ncbi:putative baseplate assembly protein [Myxococcus sp. CA051A]|uniref:putative baseplate assembly protein n=1 Tax=Myxococcus sp. CA051A TaxID=2741739 RepID=UPI00157A550F|nr:putative baseplate assembly protein [Myxococcus sp. CA051A]NTX67263.1 putative baseplate assembly protein [Myxococcus sp. CA051A]